MMIKPPDNESEAANDARRSPLAEESDPNPHNFDSPEYRIASEPLQRILQEIDALCSDEKEKIPLIIPTELEKGGSTVLENVSALRKIIDDPDAEGQIKLEEVRDLVIQLRINRFKYLHDLGLKPHDKESTITSQQEWEAVQYASKEVFLNVPQKDDVQMYVDRLVNRGVSLLEVTRIMQEAGCNSDDYVRLFIEAAHTVQTRTNNEMPLRLATSLQDMEHYIRIGGGENASEASEFLSANEVQNFLRVPGILDRVEYDELHRRGLYDFTNRLEPYFFAQFTADYGECDASPLVEGKVVLTLGPGNGSDEIYFVERGAQRIDMIEVSPLMVEKLHYRKAALRPVELQSRLNVPFEAADMIQALRRLDLSDEEKYDLIYSHSVLHFLDDEHLQYLLMLIHRNLNDENGHLAFAVKTPGAVLDNDDAGILLIDDTAEFTLPADSPVKETRTSIRQRLRLNLDGIPRAFRDVESWSRILEMSGFEIVSKTVQDVKTYAAPGQPKQTFFYFLCKKVA